MSTIKKTTFAIFALGAGLALAPSLYAQQPAPGPTAPATSGAMDHRGGMMGGGMSGMAGGGMEEMMKMMENCSRMMHSMNAQPPAPPTPPTTPGQRG